MFDRIKLNNEREFKEWRQDLRGYDYDFDPHVVEYPAVVCYQKSESNGYPYVYYDIEYPEENKNEKLRKIISILEQSDIVWTKYGSETIESLAQKIFNIDK